MTEHENGPQPRPDLGILAQERARAQWYAERGLPDPVAERMGAATFRDAYEHVTYPRPREEPESPPNPVSGTETGRAEEENPERGQVAKGEGGHRQ
jgi:hypothetical protein